MDNKLKSEFDKINIPGDISKRATIGIEMAEQELNRKVSSKNLFRKTALYFTSAAILIVGLLVGSIFISPAMAEVASKIPFLRAMFDLKPIHEEVRKELDKEGFNVGQVSVRYVPDPSITIPLTGESKDNKQVQLQAEEVVKDILRFRNYDNYEVNVVSGEVDVPDAPLSQGGQRQFVEEIIDKAELNGFKVFMIGVRPDKKIITVQVPKTEIHDKKIKEIVLESAKKQGYHNYSVKFDRIEVGKKPDIASWEPVINIINEGLIGRSDFKVSKVGYSDTNPFTIIIYTSISASSSEKETAVADIMAEINELLASKNVRDRIKGSPYKIIIKSKDGSVLN